MAAFFFFFFLCGVSKKGGKEEEKNKYFRRTGRAGATHTFESGWQAGTRDGPAWRDMSQGCLGGLVGPV